MIGQTMYGLFVVPPDGRGAREVFAPPSGYALEPAWSRDGLRVAVNGDRANVVSTEPTVVGVPVGSPSWAPDGRRLVGVQYDSGDLVIVDLRTGEQRTVYEPVDGLGSGPDPEPYDPDWSPHGQLVVMALGSGKSSRLGFFDIVRGRFVSHRLRTGDGLRDVWRPAWSPDGRRIAFDARPRARPSGPRSIYLAVSGAAPPRMILADAHSPAWSADGKRIVFVRDVTPSNSEIFVANANGTGVRRLTHHPGPDFAPAWRPPPRRQ